MKIKRNEADIPDSLRFCGMYIRQLRTRYSLSQQDMATILGCSATNISASELGLHLPSPVIQVKTCRVFGVSSDWLLGLASVEINPAALLKAEEYILGIPGTGGESLRSCPGYKDPVTRNRIYNEENRRDILVYASILNTGNLKLARRTDAEYHLKKCLENVG